MIAYLDGPRYARFKAEFASFLQTPGVAEPSPTLADGEPRPRRLSYVAPVVVYQRVAAVRAYDEWVAQADTPLERLHQLRIAAKRLRYALEFLVEVLAPEVVGLINRVKRLQDHLGDLNDARVASCLIAGFIESGTWTPADASAHKVVGGPALRAPAVADYLASRQDEMARLRATFPQAWAQFLGDGFDDLIAAALMGLHSRQT
jgi:CHAD domain-containing protein